MTSIFAPLYPFNLSPAPIPNTIILAFLKPRQLPHIIILLCIYSICNIYLKVVHPIIAILYYKSIQKANS